MNYLRSLKGFEIKPTLSGQSFNFKNVDNQRGTGIIITVNSITLTVFESTNIDVILNGEQVATKLNMLNFFWNQQQAIVLPIDIPENADIVINSENWDLAQVYELTITYMPLDEYQYTGSYFIPQTLNKTIAIGRQFSNGPGASSQNQFILQRGRGNIHYLRIQTDADIAKMPIKTSNQVRITVASNGQAIIENCASGIFNPTVAFNRYNFYIPVLINAGATLLYLVNNNSVNTINITTTEIYAPEALENG